MKFFTSQTTIKVAGFIVLLATSITNVYSQGPTSPGYALSSCYHILSPTNANPTLNVLNVGEFHFNYSNNAGAKPDYLRIKLRNKDGLFIGYNYDGIGISSNEFPVISHPDYGQIVAAQSFNEFSKKWLVNSNLITWPDEIGTVEISTLHWTGEEGNRTLDESTKKLTLNLISPEDAFTLESNNDDCFTFDNFNMIYLDNLDGFCGRLTDPLLSLAPPPPVGSGWNSNFSQQLVFNTTMDIDQPAWNDEISWCDEKCTDVFAPSYTTDPVPCGCVDFTVKLI
ncbi:MAG: hypothetical protein ACI9NN_001698, partial [Bacteroidia bacterium]